MSCVGRTLLSGNLLLFRPGFAVLAAEALDAAGGIDQLLLAGEERVATRADFYVDVALMRGTRGECAAARAMHAYFVVCRMDGCLHWVSKCIAEPFDSKGGPRDSANALRAVSI